MTVGVIIALNVRPVAVAVALALITNVVEFVIEFTTVPLGMPLPGRAME